MYIGDIGRHMSCCMYDLVLHSVLNRRGLVLLLLPGSGFELGGSPSVHFALRTDGLFLGSKGVGLGTQTLFVLRSCSGDQRCCE